MLARVPCHRKTEALMFLLVGEKGKINGMRKFILVLKVSIYALFGSCCV